MQPLDQCPVVSDAHGSDAKVKRRTRKAAPGLKPKGIVPSGDEFAGHLVTDANRQAARNRRGQVRLDTQKGNATADEFQHAGQKNRDAQNHPAGNPSGQAIIDTHAHDAAGDSFADQLLNATQETPVGNGRGLASNDTLGQLAASDNLSAAHHGDDTQTRSDSAAGGCGQNHDDTHDSVATPLATNFDGPLCRDAQCCCAVDGDDVGLNIADAQEGDANVVPGIIELYRRRKTLVRARTSLTLQISAQDRTLAVARHHRDGIELPKGGKFPKPNLEDQATTAEMYPQLFQCRDILDEAIKDIEKRLKKMARTLPVWPWAADVRGLAEISLASIIGEAGDLSQYSSPAKLWKRMGVGLFDKGDGEFVAQRKFANAETAELAGYNPERRAALFVVGDCFIRAGGRGRVNPYATLYRWQRRKYRRRDDVKTKIHAHKMAHRWMTKRLLRDLWRAWRDASGHCVFDAQIIVAARIHQLPVAAE